LSRDPAGLVHLDDRFAVLAKPAGLSLRTPRATPHAAAERLIAALPPAARAGLEGRPVWLVHRLDESTSGLVIVAFDEAMHRDLARLFAAGGVEKRYLALVWGHPRPPVGSWEAALGPDRDDRRRMRVAVDGKRAVSGYRTLARAPHVALLELAPRTGRTHQLRVHAAAAGHPVVGDDLYGGPRERGVHDARRRAALSVGRSLLHAWRLEIAGWSPGRFVAPLPADFAAALAGCGIPLDFPAES